MPRKKKIIVTTMRHTLKRQRLIKELQDPKNKNLPLNKISHKAGWSKTSRRIYSEETKRYIKEILSLTGYDLETLKRKFILLEKIAVNKGDLSNARACNEDLVRMQAGFTDTQKVDMKADIHTHPAEEKVLNRYSPALCIN